MQGFLFGGDTGVSQDDLERRRRLAQAIAGRQQPIRSVGDGIYNATSSVAAALLNRSADKDESKAREQFMASLPPAFGGTSARPTPSNPTTTSPGSPAVPATSSPVQTRGPMSQDAFLSAIDNAEGSSDGDVSPDGAMHNMQVMPSTASDPGFNVDSIFDRAEARGIIKPGMPRTQENAKMLMRASPEMTNQLGTDYALAMRDRYDDPAKAAAAYNAGAGAVDQHGGVPPFQETQRYVKEGDFYRGTAPDTAPAPGGRGQPTQTAQGALQQPQQPQQPQQAPQQSMASIPTSKLAQIATDWRAPEGAKLLAQQALQSRMTEPENPIAKLDARAQAAGLRPGTSEYQDFMRSGGRAPAQTNVNVDAGAQMDPRPQVGTIPQGYQAVYDQQAGTYRMEPIPGSDAARQLERADEAKQAKRKNTERKANIVLDDLGRMRELVQDNPYLTTGLGGVIMSQIAGTDAADVAQLSDTVGANIAFDRLAQMRAESPTGGSLGQITERELDLLKATQGSLAQSQSAEQFVRNLERLDALYRDILRKASAYPNAEKFGFSEAPDNASENESIDSLVEKYGG